MLFFQNLLGIVVWINFCLFYPPTQHVHLFTISVKNQARLARKIVGSYSWVFTVYGNDQSTISKRPSLGDSIIQDPRFKIPGFKIPRSQESRSEKPRSQKFRSEKSRSDKFKSEKSTSRKFRSEKVRSGKFRSEKFRSEKFRSRKFRSEKSRSEKSLNPRI